MEIRESDRAGWEAFGSRSPQYTIFCSVPYLESYEKPLRFLLCYKEKEIIAGYAFAESENSILSLPFHTYAGIIFNDLSVHKPVVQNDLRFAALEAFAQYLFQRYDQVQIANHWDVTDMRPFQWYNYHELEKGFYSFIIRYTSQLDISNPEDLSGLRKGRKHSLSKAQRFNPVTKVSEDIGVLDQLHDLTFKRQGITRPPEEQRALLNICRNLLAANAGKLLITEADNMPASAGFFAYDRFRGYYLFGATDPEKRDLESGSRNLYDAICFLQKELHQTQIDLVGVNSPQRGSFKLSFGGSVVPYFLIAKVPAAASKA